MDKPSGAGVKVHLLRDGLPICGQTLKPSDDVSAYLARVTCPTCRRKAAERSGAA